MFGGVTMNKLLLLFALAVYVPVARAAEGAKAGGQVEESASETARGHAKKGGAFYNLGKFQEAVTEFEAAYQFLPVPALLFNIAQCYRQLDNLPMAARLYQSFLRSNPSESAGKQAQELLDKVESDLKNRKATAASPPLELSLPSAIPAVAQSPGANARPLASTAAVPQGSRPISQAAPAASLRATPPEPAVEHHRWPALALGAVGVAALAGGVFEGLGSSSASSQLTTLHQQNAVVDPAQDGALRSQASSKHIRARNLYLASVAAFAAGGILYFVF